MSLRVDVLLPNTSQYEVLHHFARKLFEAFQRQGYACRLLTKEEYSKTLFQSPPDFTVGFNGAPVDERGEFLCDQASVPHLSCLVDPPYRFLQLQTSPYIFVTCDDRFWVEAFKTVQHPNYYFMPHGVEKELAPDPLLKRAYDIVFLGTFIDGEKHRKSWRSEFPEPVWKAMEEAAEAALADENLHFMQALLSILNEKKQFDAIEHFDLASVGQELELYIKARDRIDLIRSIKSSQVDIFGGTVDDTGWQQHFAKQSNVVVHPPVSYHEALRIMKQAKIVLNSGLKNVYGAHERVFSGLAAGAAVLTSSNPFLREHFTDGESILLYRHNDLALVDDLLQHYLHDEQARQALVQAGRSLVMKHHTWDVRLRDLLPAVLPAIQALK